jgi:hypothetical protein
MEEVRKRFTAETQRTQRRKNDYKKTTGPLKKLYFSLRSLCLCGEVLIQEEL